MKLLTCGPTSISEEVKKALLGKLTNTDLDKDYVDFHRKVEKKYSNFVGGKDARSFFMLGEAIISLEAACKSLIAKDDRVLVIHNGFFGKGFSYFVEMAGGKVVEFEGDYRSGINAQDLKSFLEKDSDFAVATLVHCETPSGITNDIDSICKILHSYGIISIVDAVSGVGGEEVNFDESKIDVLLGGSQKCFSLPPGLGMITVSKKAEEKIKNNRKNVKSLYLSFADYLYRDGLWPFPYTVNGSLINALNTSMDELLKEDFVSVHKFYADKVRHAFKSAGYKLFANDSYSNTLTAIELEEGRNTILMEELLERGFFISGGVGELENKIVRIGHMGNNNRENYFGECFKAIDEIVAKNKWEYGKLTTHYTD